MKKKNNIPKTFFSFLSASILFWLLINLSKEYTTEITIRTTYTNLATNKTIINAPVKKISLLVKGSGFKLIASNFNNNTIALDLGKAKNKETTNYYFLTKKLQKKIQDKLKSGVQLIQVQKDTIPLQIGTLHSKKVPLKTNLDITFQLGYNLASPIKTTPDTVLISGEQSLIKKINFLNLENKKLENVSKNIKVKSNINIPENIKLSDKFAEINIVVDKFTEGEIEVPILVKNAPKSINIFPKKVKIIYKVGLKNFNKVNANLFKITCDYNDVKINESSYLIPKLTQVPDSITLVRIVPKKIDFLIRK
ncbi:hypothetical protein [Tenacibaculum aestuariivivum]|uniref:hypothetical protein n=1 Tax=Tenacibaculum aestuariivivum TaxID=2006131 RepID=UPI003AB902DA